MVLRLAYGNAKKSLGSFFIYFLTLSLAVAIFYAFVSSYPQMFSLIDEKIINENMENLVVLKSALTAASVLVSLMFAFLVSYSNRFFLKRRQKELGLYMILGMNKGEVASIFLIETLGVSIISFVFGILLGVGVSQLLGLFSLQLLPGTYSFFFSTEGLLISLGFFLILVLLVLIADSIYLGRTSLLNVLKGETKNEKISLRKHKTILYILLIAAIALFSVGCVLMAIAFLETCFLVFIIGSISGFLFFYSFSALSLLKVRSNSKFYYHGLNSFITKELSSEINSSSLCLAFVSLTMILTVLLMSLGLGIQTGNSGTDNWFGIAYIGLYMGVSFMLSTSSLLSIRLLSSFYSSQSRFRFLRYLGCSQNDLKNVIKKEVGIYFLYPICFALIPCICGLYGAFTEASRYMQISLTQGTLISIAVVLLVYVAYGLSTYFSGTNYIVNSIEKRDR